MGLLDLLFPKYCINCKKLGLYLCDNCFSYISFTTSSICLACNRASFDGFTHPGCKGKYAIDGVFSGISYKGVTRKLIFQFKYKPYLSQLCTVLGDLFYESLIQHERFMKTIEQLSNRAIVFVPIPLHGSKLKSRGYNHALILAEELGKRFNLPIVDCLLRVKKTSSQFGLTRKERIENISGAFAFSPNILISQYKNIFLVDDILTTGTTLSEAAYVLKKNGVKKVWGLTLAQD